MDVAQRLYQRLLDERDDHPRPRHPDHGGVGLGLSIAQDVARRHGGQLVLFNHPQGGLVARLRLPRQT